MNFILSGPVPVVSHWLHKIYLYPTHSSPAVTFSDRNQGDVRDIRASAFLPIHLTHRRQLSGEHGPKDLTDLQLAVSAAPELLFKVHVFGSGPEDFSYQRSR